MLGENGTEHRELELKILVSILDFVLDIDAPARIAGAQLHESPLVKRIPQPMGKCVQGHDCCGGLLRQLYAGHILLVRPLRLTAIQVLPKTVQKPLGIACTYAVLALMHQREVLSHRAEDVRLVVAKDGHDAPGVGIGDHVACVSGARWRMSGPSSERDR